LSTIGTMRTAASLQRVLVDPSAALLPMNRQVRARFLAPGDAESFLINPVDADVETPPLTLLQNWRPDPE
jgi:hypothetical protein